MFVLKIHVVTEANVNYCEVVHFPANVRLDIMENYVKNELMHVMGIRV